MTTKEFLAGFLVTALDRCDVIDDGDGGITPNVPMQIAADIERGADTDTILEDIHGYLIDRESRSETRHDLTDALHLSLFERHFCCPVCSTLADLGADGEPMMYAIPEGRVCGSCCDSMTTPDVEGL